MTDPTRLSHNPKPCTIKAMREHVAACSYAKFTWPDIQGHVLADCTTMNAVLTAYDRASENVKPKVQDLVESSYRTFEKVLAIVFK